MRQSGDVEFANHNTACNAGGTTLAQILPEISDADFGAALQSADRPVVVEFHTRNCPYCRRLEPILEQAAADYGRSCAWMPRPTRCVHRMG